MNAASWIAVTYIGADAIVKLTTLTLRHRAQVRRDRARQEATP